MYFCPSTEVILFFGYLKAKTNENTLSAVITEVSFCPSTEVILFFGYLKVKTNENTLSAVITEVSFS